MKIRIIILSMIIVSTGVLSYSAKAQDNKKEMDDKHKTSMHHEIPDLKSWPEASRMAAKEMMDKYGNPDVMSNDVLVWMNKGPWKRITVDKMETKHSFPIEHTDMLKQTISYKVPMEKYDELAQFDGSVIVNRTEGLLSARCDMEANNFLALNLAHDVITGKKTVEQARKAFADIVKEKMNGGDPQYMQKLSFSPQEMTNDPGINTTGLTKEDVMKGIKKHAKSESN